MNTPDPNITSLERTRNQLRSLPKRATAAALVLIVILATHTALVALWVAPTNSITEQVGIDRLRSYINPTFQQGWSLFAPNPSRTNDTFVMRAEIADLETGDTEVTEWVDLVEFEENALRGDPFASRSTEISRSIGKYLTLYINDLSEGQRELVESNYHLDSLEELHEDLYDEEGAGSYTVDSYMRAEYAAVDLATAYAHHRWDGEILDVQIRTTEQMLPPIDEWDEKGLEDATLTEYEFGWRPAAELTEQQIELFARYASQGGGLE